MALDGREKAMKDEKLEAALAGLKGVPLINIVGNVVAITFTIIFFSVIHPKLIEGDYVGELWERVRLFLLVAGVMWVVAAPINFAFWFPTKRALLKALTRQDGESAGPRRRDRAVKRALIKVLSHHKSKSADSQRRGKTVSVVGQILNLPLRSAVINLSAWVIGGIVFNVIPDVTPEYFPWDRVVGHRIFFGMLFVGTFMAVIIYFVTERWLRRMTLRVFSADELRALPRSITINVLPRMLLVTILVGTLPVSVVSHITLRQIQDIQRGLQSIDTFLAQMPVVITVLLAFSLIMGVQLSFLLAHSISDPLRSLKSSMKRVGSGDLDVSVPVISNDEVGEVSEGFNSMLEDKRRLDSIRDTFGRYLSQEVVNEILKSPDEVNLEGEVRDVTILVSDLREFTAMTESLNPRVVMTIINRYFERMTDVIVEHEGTIDEFTGDGILVFFGAPRFMADHPSRAAACALAMQAAMNDLNRDNADSGLPELRMGIGVNSGELVVGNIGGEKRKKYGAVGSAINIAFRVEAQSSAGEVLITPTVYQRLNGAFEILGQRTVTLKGIVEPITLYELS